MADDDVFADLIGSAGFKPLAKPVAQPQLGSIHAVHIADVAPAYTRNELAAAGSSSGGSRGPVLPEPDLMDSVLDKPEANGSSSQPLIGLTMSKDDLEGLVRQVMESALDSTMSKFVRSLRTVLEDLGKRVEATSSACGSLKDSLDALREELDSQSSNVHARF
eukprot:gene76-226_t